MTAPSAFKKATRRAAKLKLGLQGPSGSGKTLAALALAQGLANGGTVAVADTENGSASLYADRYGFVTLDIAPPYLTKKYLDALAAAVAEGVSVLVFDSISHQWDGDGGILQRKDLADARPGSNHWTNWGPFTEEHNKFRAAILAAPLHIVATMRSKMAYTQTESGGKKKVEKLGLQPIQREGMEYEFTTTWDIGMDHKATTSKDRTDLFRDSVDLLDPLVTKQLLSWLGSAAPELEPDPVISVAQREALQAIAKERGMTGEQYKDFMADACGVTNSKNILLAQYDEFATALRAWKPEAVNA